MNELFEGISGFERAYWIIAAIASGVFLIIFILTFIGGDVDTSVDIEADGADFSADDGGVGFQFFTFKGVMAFFTMFGWSGLACIKAEMSSVATIIISIICGLAVMFLMSYLFYWIHKLAQSGTLKIKNAIGTICEVYIPIGASRSTIGKVQIKVQGSLRELDAITDNLEGLKTNTIVKVKDIVSAELLLVEKLSNK